MLIAQPLGLIPDWQFSNDPAVNIKINPYVQIPSDWPHGQQTVQPRNYFSAKASGDPLSGLGITMAHWAQPRAELGAIEFFDSWAWRNKKWLVLGGVALLGLGVLSTAGALLR